VKEQVNNLPEDGNLGDPGESTVVAA